MSITSKKPNYKIGKDEVQIGLNSNGEKIIINLLTEPQSRQSRVAEPQSRVAMPLVDTIKPIPYLDLANKQRSAIFISGISGSGKSTVARELIHGYLSILGKKTRIILFTQTQDLDPAFDVFSKKGYNFVHVCIKTDQMFPFLTPEMLKDSVCVFDDYENLDKDLQGFTFGLIKDILERGRKMNIQTILINHQTQNYSKTRPLIFEADTFVLFPNSNKNSVKKFLLSYSDLDKKEVDEIIELAMNRFDFLLFRKSYPRYVMTKKLIKLIN